MAKEVIVVFVVAIAILVFSVPALAATHTSSLSLSHSSERSRSRSFSKGLHSATITVTSSGSQSEVVTLTPLVSLTASRSASAFSETEPRSETPTATDPHSATPTSTDSISPTRSNEFPSASRSATGIQTVTQTQTTMTRSQVTLESSLTKALVKSATFSVTISPRLRSRSTTETAQRSRSVSRTNFHSSSFSSSSSMSRSMSPSSTDSATFATASRIPSLSRPTISISAVKSSTLTRFRKPLSATRVRVTTGSLTYGTETVAKSQSQSGTEDQSSSLASFTSSQSDSPSATKIGSKSLRMTHTRTGEATSTLTASHPSPSSERTRSRSQTREHTMSRSLTVTLSITHTATMTPSPTVSKNVSTPSETLSESSSITSVADSRSISGSLSSTGEMTGTETLTVTRRSISAERSRSLTPSPIASPSLSVSDETSHSKSISCSPTVSDVSGTSPHSLTRSRLPTFTRTPIITVSKGSDSLSLSAEAKSATRTPSNEKSKSRSSTQTISGTSTVSQTDSRRKDTVTVVKPSKGTGSLSMSVSDSQEYRSRSRSATITLSPTKASPSMTESVSSENSATFVSATPSPTSTDGKSTSATTSATGTHSQQETGSLSESKTRSPTDALSDSATTVPSETMRLVDTPSETITFSSTATPTLSQTPEWSMSRSSTITLSETPSHSTTNFLTESETVTERLTETKSHTKSLVSTTTIHVLLSTAVLTFTRSLGQTNSPTGELSLEQSKTMTSRAFTNTSLPSRTVTTTVTLTPSLSGIYLSKTVSATRTFSSQLSRNVSFTLTLKDTFTGTITDSSDTTLTATVDTKTGSFTEGVTPSRTRTSTSEWPTKTMTSSMRMTTSRIGTETDIPSFTGEPDTSSESAAKTETESQSDEATPTVTMSQSFTPSQSRSSTEELTGTVTFSRDPTHTRSYSHINVSGTTTFSRELTSTDSRLKDTKSNSSTPEISKTASPSPTFTGATLERTLSETPENTDEVTRTESRFNSSTRTMSRESTETKTRTPPPTQTRYRLPGMSRTSVDSPSDTTSASPTLSVSVSASDEISKFTASSTQTFGQLTPSTTGTASMTLSASPENTATLSVLLDSPSRSDTLSQSLSLTFSPTRGDLSRTMSASGTVSASRTSTKSSTQSSTQKPSATDSRDGRSASFSDTVTGTTRMLNLSKTTTLTQQHRTGTATDSSTISITLSATTTVSEALTTTTTYTRELSMSRSVRRTMTNETSPSWSAVDSRTRPQTRSISELPSRSVTPSVSLSQTNTTVLQSRTLTSLDTMSQTETLSRASRSKSRTISDKHSASETPEPSASVTLTATVTLTVTMRKTRTQALTASRNRHSPTVSQHFSLTASSATIASMSAARTLSLTRKHSPSETYSTDPTLTGSRTPSKETRSPSRIRTMTNTRTRTGLSNTASILGFVAAVAGYLPLQPTVMQPITFSLTACPTYVNGDIAYMVPLPSVAGALCGDRARSRNASLLKYISGNVTLPVVFQGSVRVVGAYELCVYSSTKREWSVVQPWPYLFASPYVVPNSITPRVHATSGTIQLRLSAFGAAPTDHVLILPSVFSTFKNPCDPTVLHAIKFNSFIQVTNVSFSSRQTVAVSGDFAVCYWGAPYMFYRVIQSRWRIEGRVDGIATNYSNATIATYVPFSVDVFGLGLSTRDPFMIANGTSCSNSQKLVAGRDYDTTVLTPPALMPTLSKVSHSLIFFTSSPAVSLCVRSNSSNYFSKVSQWAVPYTTASMMAPTNVTVASGAFINFTFWTTAGTLDPTYDTAFMCVGATCGCPRSLNPLTFNTSSGQWEGLAPSLLKSAASIASVCYATNTSQPWSLQPTGLFMLRRYLHVPDQLLPVVSGKPRGMFIASDGLNVNRVMFFVIAATTTAGRTTPALSCASSLSSSSAPLSTSVVSLSFDPSIAYVEVTPHRVLPLRLCAVDPDHQGAVFASQDLVVLPSPPTGFAPNEFFANTTSTITFFPADGRTFSFLEANTSLVACSALTPPFIVEQVVNVSTLRIRFLTITTVDVSSGALCFSVRNSSGSGSGSSNDVTLLPISQSATGVLRVSPIMTSAVLASPSFTQTNGAITLVVTGYDLEASFISIVPCSSSPLLIVSLLENTSVVFSNNVTAWTLTYDVESSVTAEYAICYVYTRSSGQGGSLRALVVDGRPLTLTFDSVAVAAAQLPNAPHPVTINPLLHVFSLSVAASDQSGVFTGAKAVRFVPSSVSPCDEPSLPLFPLNSTIGVWRYDLKTRNVLRGGVLLCYRSLSLKWYLFTNSDTTSFFNQAVILPTTFSFNTPVVGATVFATCEASLMISGYQLDGSADAFFLITSSSGDDCGLYTNLSSSGNASTVLPAIAVQRDTTNLANLVNITFSYTAGAAGSFVLCSLLGRASRGVTVGVFTAQNPLALANSNTVQLACQSKLVLTSPVTVAYKFELLLATSSKFLALSDITTTSIFTLDALPATSFTLRMTVLQPSLGNAILINVTRSFNATFTPSSIRAGTIYCNALQQKVRGESVRDFASSVIFLANYRDAACDNLFSRGYIENVPSTVLNAVVSLINALPQLVWDGTYFFGLVGYLAPFDTNPTTQLTMLLNLTDPMTLYGGNVSDTLSGQLALVAQISRYLTQISLSSSSSSVSSSTLGFLVMQRVVDVYQVCCQFLPTGSTVTAQAPGSSMGISNGLALTSVDVGDGSFISLPLPGNLSAPACRGIAVLPTFLKGSQTSSSTSRRSASASSSPDPALNLSTAVVLSDSPISSFAVGYSWNISSVDFVTGYRYYPTDPSSFRSSSGGGGVWAKQQNLVFSYQAPQLIINVSGSSPATGNFAVFSGIAVKYIVDPLAAKLQQEKDRMTNSGYYILLSIILFQVVGVFGSAWFDRWNNTRRLKAAKDFIYGRKSIDPNFFQLHRLLSLFADLNISLTPSEQVIMLHKAGDEPLRNGSEPVTALEGPSFHPTHCISTVAKHALLCMHLFCLALASCFTLRYDIASQVPFLLADWVGFGIVAALFAWPLSVWTRVVLMRNQRDVASLAATVAAIGGCIIAALVSSKDLLSMLAVLIAVGLFVFAIVVAFARRWWSSLHFINVNTVVRAVGSTLFISAELSAIIVLFFVPYFSDRLTIYTSRPYLGNDPQSPDGSGLWKSFCFALFVDLVLMETAKALFLYKLHQATHAARWTGRDSSRSLHAPTDGGPIGSVTKRLSTYSLDPPTKSVPRNIEELYGDSDVKEVENYSLPPSTSFHYDPKAGLIEEVASEFDDVESNEFEDVLPVTTEVVVSQQQPSSFSAEPFADIPRTHSTVFGAPAQPNPLRESELWNWRQPDTRRSMRIAAPSVTSQQQPPSATSPFRLRTPVSPTSPSDFDYLDGSPR